MPVRRINFFGGPGVGKSTLAPDTYSYFKKRHRNVESVAEWIKGWAHQGYKPRSHDQLFVFGNQLHAEDTLLQSVDFVASDSPLLLNTAYSTFYKFRGAKHLIALAHNFERDFSSLNFFIDRTVPYDPRGRYQNEQEAKEFDAFLLDFLDDHLELPLHHVTVDEFDLIIKMIEEHL